MLKLGAVSPALTTVVVQRKVEGAHEGAEHRQNARLDNSVDAIGLHVWFLIILLDHTVIADIEKS